MFLTNSKNTSLLKKSLEEIYQAELTQEQALESEHNFLGFFELLYQIDQRNQKQEKTSNDDKNK